MKDLIQELTWRGMIHDMTPGLAEEIRNGRISAYLGIDPTASSLHIGHLCGIMMLRHLQRCGHRPIALIGGATGMIGDPSGKSDERNLLDSETVAYNVECIKKQLARFLNFGISDNQAVITNNLEWMHGITFLDFARNVGKTITVNYMMAKDSVKRRIQGEDGNGMSFTEFTYQLLQGYDFVYLNRIYGCLLQIGGSDQWGNMTTGVDMVRKMNNQEVFALTCPLLTKADGRKFGKTENGNIWLDRERTTPYQFYQFWLNVNDTDAERYIKIFTDIEKDEYKSLLEEHRKAPHLRLLQKRLAKDVTIMVHSREDFEQAERISGFLFGNEGIDSIMDIIRDKTTSDLEQMFRGIEGMGIISPDEFKGDGINILDMLRQHICACFSRKEGRNLIQSGAIRINGEKITDENTRITESDLLCGKCLFIRKGQKKWYLAIAGTRMNDSCYHETFLK